MTANVLQFKRPDGKIIDVDLRAFTRTEYPSLMRSTMDDEFRELGWQRIQHKDDTYGDALPWTKTHEKMRFRPGEVSVWIGPNGEGKSLLLGYVIANWALQETRCLMCSLELSVGEQLARLSRQLLCVDSPPRPTYDMLMNRLNHLTFFNHLGYVAPATMLDLVRYAATIGGFSHIVIDNLTFIVPPGLRSDEHAVVFVRSLVQIARETGCHVHLVGHVRKPDAKQPFLNRYDWRGTGACADMVHNVLIAQMNEKKRRAVEDGDFSMSEKPDVYLIVDKQRTGAYRGRFGLWWRAAAMRLVEYGTEDPIPFDPDDFSMWER